MNNDYIQACDKFGRETDDINLWGYDLSGNRFLIGMSTINRKPVKTHVYRYDSSIVIDWKCHGIDQHGNRQKWTERTYTHPLWIETYDDSLFSSKMTYSTTRKIFPPKKFEAN